MINDPAAWNAVHDPEMSHMHATYPRDGRETIYEPYENAAKTDTVGAYLAAAKRVRERDANLPNDFASYLGQRVPSARHFASIAPDTPIDRHGRLVHGSS